MSSSSLCTAGSEFAERVRSETVYRHAGRYCIWSAVCLRRTLLFMVFTFSRSVVLGFLGVVMMFLSAACPRQERPPHGEGGHRRYPGRCRTATPDRRPRSTRLDPRSVPSRTAEPGTARPWWPDGRGAPQTYFCRTVASVDPSSSMSSLSISAAPRCLCPGRRRSNDPGRGAGTDPGWMKSRFRSLAGVVHEVVAQAPDRPDVAGWGVAVP